MPDHFHVLAETAQPDRVRLELAHQLSGFARKNFPGRCAWERVEAPTVIPDLHHLKRQVRYVHLNPCRRGLTADPLVWEWSTHREAVGAAAPGWLDREVLIEACKTSSRAFEGVFHRYVSSDPSAHVSGTSLPLALRPEKLIASGEFLVKAVLQASRVPAISPALKRRVVLLGSVMNVQRTETLAQIAGLSVCSVRRVVRDGFRDGDQEVVQAATYLLSAPERFGLRG
jgi:hypothetical protein